jgi:hypothetical protein
MNQKQSWKEKFYEKFPQKIAGVIDDFGSNEKEDIGNFIEESIKQAIQTREREISEEVDKEFGTLTDFFGNDAKPRLKALINHQ